MKYGITVKDFSDCLVHAIEDTPQISDAIIDNFDTILIEDNGFFQIKMHAKGDYGNEYTITKCLIPRGWTVPDE